MRRSLILYILFLVIFSLFSYLFVDSNLTYLKFVYSGFSTNHREWTSLLYLILISIYFVFYFYFLKETRKGSINFKKIILLSVGILFLSYPAMLSYDIFNYLTTSKILFVYHENPYLFTPQTFIGEPFLEFTRATNKVALYGPLWIVFSGLPYTLEQGNFFGLILGFKAISAIFYFALCSLIYKITKNNFSTAIFALNPLVQIESLVSGHNDIFMIFLAVLSFYYLSHQKLVKSILLLFLSVLVKYATLFLVPVFIFNLIKKIRGKSIDLSSMYFIASLSMLMIFFLSSLREEIYPWYAIWFLAFAATVPNKKILLYFSLGISFGLMLSYVPFMVSGNYFGVTPYLRYSIILVSAVGGLLFGVRKRPWLKKLPFQS